MNAKIDDNNGSNKPPGGRILRVFGAGLITLALLAAFYGTVAYLAWQRGQSQRLERSQRELEEQLADQISLAVQDMESGNHPLALRRLEWVLTRSPEYPGAVQLEQQVLNALNRPPASPLPPTPTSPPPTPPIATLGPDPAVAFAEVEILMADHKWQEAMQALTVFRNRYPDFRRQESDRLLYEASINLGLELIYGDQVELGLFYLSQAESLGDLPIEVEDQRTWAELYLEGIGFYGVDWGTAVFYFRGLCAAAPFYQASCDRLYQALVAYGDQYRGALDWCPAAELYGEALGHRSNAGLEEKAVEADSFCLSATPTPSPTPAITGTVDLPVTPAP